MPISSIAQILLRLFALNWFFTGMIQIASLMFLHDYEPYSLYSLAPGLIYVVMASLFWRLAPLISRLIAKRNDGEVNLAGVTERQLFSTAFLSLGLYFALDSFSNVFSWIHFFVINKSPNYGFHHEEEPSYYLLLESLLTLAAGTALILTAQTWAKKLTR